MALKYKNMKEFLDPEFDMVSTVQEYITPLEI
jgi:hypothetical protein